MTIIGKLGIFFVAIGVVKLSIELIKILKEKRVEK